MQSTATDPLVGRSLEGRYRILERIARGGMSTVYAAVDERLDRLVAVKVMSSSLSADPVFTDRFVREARSAARLTHLNVVSVYDQGHDGGHVFLVMELVEGRTLRELLHERGRLAPGEALSIMEPVLSALAAAHRAGLVHRDVKPENILVSDHGVVKVADFGLAHAVEAEATAARTGLMMGTVAYCSPEQLSQGRADPRSDVYAAGVVFFELLTGHPPYRGETPMNIAWQHVHSRVPAPSSQLRGHAVPAEIDELVVAATDSDPGGRPGDAGALLAELADVRTALALPVAPVPARARPARSRGPREAPAAAAHTGIATDVLNGGPVRHDTVIAPGFSRRSTRPERSAGEAPPPPPVVISPRYDRKRRRRRVIVAVLVVLLIGAAVGYAGWWFGAGRYSTVPKLSGDSRSDAVTQLQSAGYHVSVQPGPEYDGTVPKGRVLRTDPASAARAVRGSTVTLVMSAGPHYYSIPKVAGRSPDGARDALLQAGPLRVSDTVHPESSESVHEGDVTRTVPTAGRRVKTGQQVVIYVSTGPPVESVPGIGTGTPYQDAENMLETSSGAFQVDIEREHSDTVPRGGVISVSPSDRARRHSTITLTVSRGPQFVTVPAIGSGMPLDQAKQQLAQAGLQLKEHDLTPGADTVFAVRPGAGTQLRPGSTVAIYAYHHL